MADHVISIGKAGNSDPGDLKVLLFTLMSPTCRYIALTPIGSNTSTRSGPGALFEEHGSKSEDGIMGSRSHNTGVTLMLRDLYRGNIGLLLVVAAQVFYAVMLFTVKQLSTIDPPVSVLELIGVRMVITYTFSVAYMLFTGVPDPFIGPKEVRLLLIFRGASGFLGISSLYYSLQYLSLSDATVLTFLAPMFTVAAGSIFLGEKYSLKQALVGSLSLVGVILIAKPPFVFHSGDSTVLATEEGPPSPSSREITPEQRLIAVGVALIGVLGSTGVYISLRAIGKRAHPLHTLVSYSTQCGIIAPIGMLVTKTPFVVPARPEWLAMLLMAGITGFIAQILLAMGLARETAGRGTTGCYTQIVFATILERIFLHTIPSISSVIGTLVIISSALYVALARETGSTDSAKGKQSMSMLNDEENAVGNSLLQRRESEESQYEGGGSMN